MTGEAGDKYLTTRALELFDGARERFWKWLFDEEHHFRRPTAIAYFIFFQVETDRMEGQPVVIYQERVTGRLDVFVQDPVPERYGPDCPVDCSSEFFDRYSASTVLNSPTNVMGICSRFCRCASAAAAE
jgi:hypothetical protein